MKCNVKKFSAKELIFSRFPGFWENAYLSPPPGLPAGIFTVEREFKILRNSEDFKVLGDKISSQVLKMLVCLFCLEL